MKLIYNTIKKTDADFSERENEYFFQNIIKNVKRSELITCNEKRELQVAKRQQNLQYKIKPQPAQENLSRTWKLLKMKKYMNMRLMIIENCEIEKGIYL